MSEVQVAAEPKPPKPEEAEADGEASVSPPPPSEMKSGEPSFSPPDPPRSGTASTSPCVRTALAAALALCAATGAGVGIGYYAAVPRFCGTAAAAGVGATGQEGGPLAMIAAGARSRCGADAISSQGGLEPCRDFCAPAACCFSPSSQQTQQVGWERDGISGTGYAGRSGMTGSTGWTGGSQRELGAGAARAGAASKVSTGHAGGGGMPCLGQDICEAFGPCSILYEDDYAALQSEVRAKCHTGSLFSPEGVGACLELCTPALDAGCFANEAGDADEDDQDGELQQEGKVFVWNDRHRGLDAESRGPLCHAYAACRTLVYLQGASADSGLDQDDVAHAVVEEVCNGDSDAPYDYGACLDVCDPAECCFATQQLGQEGRSHHWSKRVNQPDNVCAAEGLSDVRCDHYDPCSILLSNQSSP